MSLDEEKFEKPQHELPLIKYYSTPSHGTPMQAKNNSPPRSTMSESMKKRMERFDQPQSQIHYTRNSYTSHGNTSMNNSMNNSMNSKSNQRDIREGQVSPTPTVKISISSNIQKLAAKFDSSMASGVSTGDRDRDRDRDRGRDRELG